MKNKFAIFMMSTLCVGSFMTSCTDLDSDKYFDDRKTLTTVFTDKTQSEEWLAYAYTFLTGVNDEICSKGSTASTGGWNPFCFDDDIYYGDRDNTYGDHKDADWSSYNSFHEGNYDESIAQDSWTHCYRGIYQASVFIHNIDQNTEMTEKERTDYKGQARFVRAYFYWLLLRKYGPVPIAPDEGFDYTASYSTLATARSTYEDVVQYIASEMLQAAKELQYHKRDGGNAGRPTIGAALATRAIVYTYAASPLANGQLKNGSHPSGVTDDAAKSLKNFDGTQLLSLDYDESKWARAAAACRDVIELGDYDLYHATRSNQSSDDTPATITPADTTSSFAHQNWPNGWANIDPFASYRNLFDGAVSPNDNPELIFSRITNLGDLNDYTIKALVMHELPVSLGGWNTHGMTMKMCDAYYMNDGTDVPGKDSEMNGGDGSERVSGWTTVKDYKQYPPLKRNVSLQYANREPRFYASVAYSGCVWEGLNNTTTSLRNKQVFYYRGSGDGYLNAFSYLRTGIGIKKWYNPYDYNSSQGNYDNISAKYDTAIRYADILLMYAECLNELNGSYQVKSWDESQTYNISRDETQMKRGIDPVRIRAGLPDYSEDTYASKDLLRAKIKRERMIEFMGEGKRYFDLRRWMDAPVEESKIVYGLNVFQTMSNKDDFQKVIPTYNLSATFSDKMWFWPISHSELKRNKLLTQNPGWTYND